MEKELKKIMLGIHIKYEYRGEKKFDGWSSDQWSVKLEKGMDSVIVPYSTGTGLRKWENGNFRKEIDITSFLESLQLDLSLEKYSFKEYCSEFGINPDSINEKKKYTDMVKVSKQLKKLLGENYYEFMEYDFNK